MKKLAQILQLAELFYQKSMVAFGAGPEEVPLVEEFESMLNDIDNQDLYTKLDKFLKLYKVFVKMLSGPAPETDADETFVDIYEALEKAWEKIVQEDPKSPYTDEDGNQVNYLNLDADNPEYTEDRPPHEIMDLVQRLLSDANEKKREKGAEAGLSSEEMESAEKKVQQDMFHGQVTKDVINKMDNAVKDQYKQKVQKQLEYQKKFRDKLKTIRDLGPDHLRKLREEIANKLLTTTNADEKKQLEMRLKSIPDPKHLEVSQAGRIRRHEKMLADPSRKTKYVESNKDRQQNRRDVTAKFLEVIEKINNSKNPAEIESLRNRLVKMEQEVLLAKKVNLNDEFVLNSPGIQRQLNPDEIIKKYTGRISKRTSHNAREVQVRQQHRDEGQVVGLVLEVKQNLSNIISDVKKALKKKMKGNFNDPFFQPYLQELSAAAAAVQTDGSPTNQAKLAAAQQKMDEAVTQFVEQHPTVVEANNRLAPLVKIKNDLQELSSMARRTGKPQTPWFYEFPLPDDKKPVINDLISRCEQAASTLQSASPKGAALFKQLATKLKEKL